MASASRKPGTDHQKQAKIKSVKVVAGVCVASMLAVVAGASLGVVSPVSAEITPAPGVTITPLPLPTTSPLPSLPAIPSIPKLPSGGLPTSLPSGIPTGLPPIKTPDFAPKPAEDKPFTETNLNIDVGKSLTVTTDASGKIQTNSFNVSTNVSGQGSGTINVPVGPNKARDVTSFAPLNVQDEAIVYDLDNQTSQVQNRIASMGQYSAQMPISMTTRITENGKSVDPNTATSLTGKIEVEWEFKNHTTSNEQISYRGPDGATVTESVAVSVPFGVGISGTFGKGWANVAAPWANTGFAVGQVISGSVTLKESSVIAKLTGLASDAQLPNLSIKATPTDSTNATSALYSKGADIGAKVDDLLRGKAVPLLVKLQDDLGKASTGVAAFLDKNVNPILDLTAKLKIDPVAADKKIAGLVNQLGDASDKLFLLNGMTESGTGMIASRVAAATSPASQKQIYKLVSKLGNAKTVLDEAIKLVPQIQAKITELATGLSTPLTGSQQAVCPGGKGPCTGADVLQVRVMNLLPTTCTSGGLTRGYLNDNAAAISLAFTAGEAALTGANKQNLAALQVLLNAQAIDNGWNVTDCQAAAGRIAAETGPLIKFLPAINADLGSLIPLLIDVDAGIPKAQVALTNFANAMPVINKALDHDCSPAVISNISECGLVQAMKIASTADAATAKEVRIGLNIIVKTLQEPLNQIFAVANDIGRGSLPLKRTLDDLPGVINELGNGPFSSFTAEAENLEHLASKLTTSASKTVATNKAIDRKFHTGEAFPYGSATGTDVKTSATYSFAVSAPGSTGVSLWIVATFAGLLALIMMGLAIWLSRRPNAV